MLETIKSVRSLLDLAYIPWQKDNGSGGHCHYGCLRAVGADNKIEHYLDLVAIDLHPELSGSVRKRPDNRGGTLHPYYDVFNQNPAMFVNNHLGKEAILAIFDEAIVRLETRMLCNTLEQTVSA